MEMKKLIRELLVLVMLGVLSVSAFGQGKSDKQRPPKDRGKVSRQSRSRHHRHKTVIDRGRTTKRSRNQIHRFPPINEGA